MITLISTIVGFLASLLPAVIKYLEKKQDNGHEITLRKLEIEAASQGIALQARMEQIKAVIEENRAIYVHDGSLTASQFINDLRASVRPVITYTFFFLFCGIKIILLMEGIKTGLPIEKLIVLVWDEYTASIFGGILAFWFGTRMWEKTEALDNVIKVKQTLEKDSKPITPKK